MEDFLYIFIVGIVTLVLYVLLTMILKRVMLPVILYSPVIERMLQSHWHWQNGFYENMSVEIFPWNQIADDAMKEISALILKQHFAEAPNLYKSTFVVSFLMECKIYANVSKTLIWCHRNVDIFGRVLSNKHHFLEYMTEF